MLGGDDMSNPCCDECGKELENWSGNIMVDGNEYPDNIKEIFVWCKGCTNKLDAKGVGRKFHNIWELSWLKKSYFDIEREIFEELKSERSRWQMPALIKINNLGRQSFGLEPKEEEEEM
jgi:hypothetical protein